MGSSGLLLSLACAQLESARTKPAPRRLRQRVRPMASKSQKPRVTAKIRRSSSRPEGTREERRDFVDRDIVASFLEHVGGARAGRHERSAAALPVLAEALVGDAAGRLGGGA